MNQNSLAFGNAPIRSWERVCADRKYRSMNLDGYLDLAVKAQNAGKTNRKDIDAKDLEISHGLMRKYYDMNGLVTEILAICKVMKRMKNNKVYMLTNNLYRIVNSLARQRDKIYVAKKCLYVLKPEPYEYQYIEKMISDAERRIAFIREKIIPENIELTMIREYLEIVGKKSLIEDIYEKIGDRKELVETSKAGDPEGKTDAYADQILETVRNAGKDTAYLDRIAVWYARSERLKEERDEEKRLEKKFLKHEITDSGMRYFMGAFNRSVRNLEDNAGIGVSKYALEKIFAKKNGRNSYVIVKCDEKGGKCFYRFYLGNGNWKMCLHGSKLFKDESECRRILEVLEKNSRGETYDMVRMSHLEGEMVG